MSARWCWAASRSPFAAPTPDGSQGADLPVPGVWRHDVQRLVIVHQIGERIAKERLDVSDGRPHLVIGVR